MSDVVSQDEMDALMDKSDGTSSEVSTEANLYDFSQKTNKGYHDLSKLIMINEQFCLNLRPKFNHFLCCETEIESLEPEIVTYEEYLNTIARPCMINFTEVKPLEGIASVTYSPEFSNKIIEKLFGGNVKNPTNCERELGKVELRIGHVLLETINQSLSEAWQQISPLCFTFLKTVTNPNIIRKADLQEPVIISRFNLQLHSERAQFSVCIFCSTLDPIKNLIDGSHDHENNLKNTTWNQHFKENILNCQVNLTSMLSEVNLTVRELSQLEVGDVIALDNPKTADIYLEDILFYRAKCGASNGNRAVMILETVKD